MNAKLYKLCVYHGVTPNVFSVLNIICQAGNGFPACLSIEFQSQINEAKIKGFVVELDYRLYLTRKAKAFLYKFLMLARNEGEIL